MKRKRFFAWAFAKASAHKTLRMTIATRLHSLSCKATKWLLLDLDHVHGAGTGGITAGVFASRYTSLIGHRSFQHGKHFGAE